MLLLQIILGLACFIILISVVWNILSRYYTIPCPTWLAWLVERDNPFSTINRAETIIKNLKLIPGMVVLDAGCGPGRLTIPLAHTVGPHGLVVALDIQAGMLEKVRQKANVAKLQNIIFLQAGIGEGKLEKNKFDRAVLVTVFGEIRDKNVAMQEIFDALQPGGILSVTEIIFDPHFNRRSTIVKYATASGFQKKESFGSCIAFTLNFEKPDHAIML
ncbi:MAG TPA: methyltransferase domain-containing protein [Candidatus Babeliales bacterium]|nr:methyltransferase domain-containing protein [Candidatus Babeliales bacterium]